MDLFGVSDLLDDLSAWISVRNSYKDSLLQCVCKSFLGNFCLS